MPKILPDLTTVQLSDIFLRVCYFRLLFHIFISSNRFILCILYAGMPLALALFSFFFFFFSDFSKCHILRENSHHSIDLNLAPILNPIAPCSSGFLYGTYHHVYSYVFLYLITVCSIQIPSLLEPHGSHLLPSIEQYDWNVVEIH